MYRALATAMAQDPALLDVATVARHGPVPNVFLAAVHDLLLQGHGVRLATFYPTLSRSPRPPGDVHAVFSDFVLSSQDNLAPLLRERFVQTNEVRRAGVLFLALAWLAREHGLQRIGLIEVGASAGLLLAVDRYAYSFGSRWRAGSDDAELTIETELRGPGPVHPAGLPHIVERVGLDLHTLDLNDEANRRWLRALVWGDHPERLAILDRAITVACNVPVRLVEGDGNRLLPGVLATFPSDLPVVVYHSHALNQFSPAARETFVRILCDGSRGRAVYRIAMESLDGVPAAVASVYRDGNLDSSTALARYDAHGAWVAWLD